jgi:hypothetical protein
MLGSLFSCFGFFSGFVLEFLVGLGFVRIPSLYVIIIMNEPFFIYTSIAVVITPMCSDNKSGLPESCTACQEYVITFIAGICVCTYSPRSHRTKVTLDASELRYLRPFRDKLRFVAQ